MAGIYCKIFLFLVVNITVLCEGGIVEGLFGEGVERVLVVDALRGFIDLDAVDSVESDFAAGVFVFKAESLFAHEHRLCLQSLGLDAFGQLAERVN
jgi:hypothetical protein